MELLELGSRTLQPFLLQIKPNGNFENYGELSLINFKILILSTFLLSLVCRFGYQVRVHKLPVEKINIDHTLEAPGSLIYSVLYISELLLGKKLTQSESQAGNKFSWRHN